MYEPLVEQNWPFLANEFERRSFAEFFDEVFRIGAWQLSARGENFAELWRNVLPLKPKSWHSSPYTHIGKQALVTMTNACLQRMLALEIDCRGRHRRHRDYDRTILVGERL